MSHANGKVIFKDGTIMHYEYNGTSDICCPALYLTYEEMNANWRNHPWRTCNCGNEEEVVIANDYGGGAYWRGKACRQCMCITKGLNPFEEEEYDGLPDWWEE